MTPPKKFAHAGPGHHRECLAPHHAGAPCRCARGDWLDEVVPRHVARAELLQQLAGWAHEQRLLTTGGDTAAALALSEYARAGVKAAAGIADALFTRMRITALHLREECTARPTPARTLTAAEQELDEAREALTHIEHGENPESAEQRYVAALLARNAARNATKGVEVS